MSNPYDLESMHRGGNITGPSGQLFKPIPNAADKAYEHDMAAAERRGEQRILREVAKIVRPIEFYGSQDDTRCFFCGNDMGDDEAFDADRHKPECVWPRAQQAAQEQE